jgi:UDP-N-acetylmuramyl pentapeptide phosphotransferase/UDP-N-acetylglucosamine-1-phosphate transferase
MNYAIIISSFSLSVILLIIFQNIFIKKNKIAIINSRSSHKSIATNSGGLAIFSTIFIISSFLYLQNIEIYDYKILVPLGLITLIGLYDDIYDIDYKLKLMFQIITAKIIIDQGFIISNLHGFLGILELSNILSQILSIFIIVAIINSINFIDGIDGLALAVISFFILCFEFFSSSFFFFNDLSIIIISASLPLWYFNYRKEKKIFLGDAGSLFLGGAVSIYTISILSSDYLIIQEYDINKIIFVITILLYPIIDIVRVFFLRLSKGTSPFIADKNHIHHYLLKKLKKHFLVVITIISFNIIFLIATQILFN